MYDAFRKTGYAPEEISVLYGGGSLTDTFTETDAAEWAAQRDKKKILSDTLPHVKPKEADPRLTSEYVFSDGTKKVDGPATKEELKKTLARLAKEAGTGDLTIFLTDHGALTDNYTMTVVNLWGHELRADEFKKMLDDLPGRGKIRLVTNICFGGGLTALTSDRVCVLASQQPNLKNHSSSKDLNLYAQHFSAAMELGFDKDKDGKATFQDAHDYATALDDEDNYPHTSLDRFLKNWSDPNPRGSFIAKSASGICVNCPQTDPTAIKDLEKVLQSFQLFEELLASQSGT